MDDAIIDDATMDGAPTCLWFVLMLKPEDSVAISQSSWILRVKCEH